MNPINNSSISSTLSAANLHPAMIADQKPTPKRFFKAIVPAYFLLLIIPKDHYWKTLGFDTCKIRYYASLKGNRYLCINSTQRKIAHQPLSCEQIFSQQKILGQKNRPVSGREKYFFPTGTDKAKTAHCDSFWKQSTNYWQ
ncbi:hypothetical protein Dbac_3431 [Desulfomicrobium baculatum DSM 4028]|uniref:Uncharacterized protein n=1 Tax=Desulfomicrobium baculatum (strain DSM 4028 / VKM B-1378 / X) TaxID=525897 RepID=C7LQJ7_DESBD|nr:hypothetical protein Dbac_3431 [Desulfomicrobium baculatum DSM 4028]